MFKSLPFLLLIAFGILLTNCTGSHYVSDFKSNYGLVSIESPKGEKFYFRREARGLNYDSLSLSKNSDVCAEPDPNSAVVFQGLGPRHPFFKFEGESLHFYLVTPANVPAAFSDNLEVVQHELANPVFINLGDDYKSKGLEMVDVPLDKSLICP